MEDVAPQDERYIRQQEHIKGRPLIPKEICSSSTKQEFIKFYLADIFWYMNKQQNIFRINLFQCLYFLTLSVLVFCNTFLYPQFFPLTYQPSINCPLMPVLDNFLHIGYTFHNGID